jgi:hypothetical protein
VAKGGKVVDADVVTLTEALMNELVKLDSIAAEGDVKVQQRMQVSAEYFLFLPFLPTNPSAVLQNSLTNKRGDNAAFRRSGCRSTWGRWTPSAPSTRRRPTPTRPGRRARPPSRSGGTSSSSSSPRPLRRPRRDGRRSTSYLRPHRRPRPPWRPQQPPRRRPRPTRSRGSTGNSSERAARRGLLVDQTVRLPCSSSMTHSALVGQQCQLFLMSILSISFSSSSIFFLFRLYIYKKEQRPR